MSDQFIGEIRIFGTNFAPFGWAFCDGQLLSISQNTALFSLLGTTYGGDGKSTFALPNLQGSSPMQQGQGAGLSDRVLGETSGTETVTLLASEIPAHTHAANCNSGMGDQYGPSGNFWATDAGGNFEYNAAATPNITMAAGALGPTGGNRPHNNLQPYLVLNFCIALLGIFPSRS
jgi:microcystin-dependent protein